MEPQELIERVMTEHWDMAACQCEFCRRGRELGFGPKSSYLTSHKISILHDPSQDAYIKRTTT